MHLTRKPSTAHTAGEMPRPKPPAPKDYGADQRRYGNLDPEQAEIVDVFDARARTLLQQSLDALEEIIKAPGKEAAKVAAFKALAETFGLKDVLKATREDRPSTADEASELSRDKLALMLRTVGEKNARAAMQTAFIQATDDEQVDVSVVGAL